MQEQVEEMAMMADMAEAEKIAELAPSGTFKRDSVNRLIKSLNEMLKHFAVPALDTVDEDVDGPMPSDITKTLLMIDAALDDAKMEEHSYDIQEIKTDRDIMMLRGKIDAAAKDRAFIAFLRKPMPNDPETEVEVNIEMDADIPEGFHRMPDGSVMADSEHEGEEDMDKLMMARMG
jgi:hypothetical protein